VCLISANLDIKARGSNRKKNKKGIREKEEQEEEEIF